MPHSDAYFAAQRADRRRERMKREAEVVRTHLWVPGEDDEPPVRAELYDLDGNRWIRSSGRGAGWHIDTTDDDVRHHELKWSAPALRSLGPFIGPRKRDPEVLAGMKRRAAEHRWHGTPTDPSSRGPLPDPSTTTGRRSLRAALD
jgi:hypothetical protein